FILVNAATADPTSLDANQQAAVPAPSLVADYVPINVPVLFLPGEMSKQVSVPVVMDNLAAPEDGLNNLNNADRFDVVLSSPFNATIDKGIGEGAIIDDDGL
ncbi:MAG: hypothetical protein HY718_00325, partial [Planctomycetes bacterium]|nr:hypothetical protein [Planctomycetota bacterium]